MLKTREQTEGQAPATDSRSPTTSEVSKGVREFTQLEVWKRARFITIEVYRLTRKIAFKEDQRLAWQMRAAAISAMSNIAEGFERGGNKEFVNFLAIAKGSCGELRTQLIVAVDVGFLSRAETGELLSHLKALSKQLWRFMQYLKSSPNRGTRFR